jgi:tRNA (guanine-N7-)-methyltransferase
MRKVIHSTQFGPHHALRRALERHARERFRRPIADFNRKAFETAARNAERIGGAIILDSGCGNGASTIMLAGRFPGHCVIGVDKSAARLERAPGRPSNCLLVHTNLVDFWRLAAAAGWRLERHFLLCPNPWPKSRHLGRRWHGHPAWPSMLALGGRVELRTNWSIYASEFALALEWAGARDIVSCHAPAAPLSPFERKYRAWGETIYRVAAELTSRGDDDGLDQRALGRWSEPRGQSGASAGGERPGETTFQNPRFTPGRRDA